MPRVRTKKVTDKKPKSTVATEKSTDAPVKVKETPKQAGTTEKNDLIKKAMIEGEFSMSELAKKLDWRFQKVRGACIQIAKQEGKTLKSVSRGKWEMESQS